MPEIREESAHLMYFGEDKDPTFILKPNGMLKWFRVVPVTIDDLKEFFNQKKA